MEIFQAHNADTLWRQSFRLLSEQQTRALPQGSRAGSTVEALHVALELEDPRQRWIVSRCPAINPAFAIAELIWLLAGRNEAAVVNYWNRQLARYAGQTPTYPGAYGHRLRNHFGFDQIRRAFEALKANPDSRQIVLQLWDAAQDLPNDDGKPRSCDVPCNVMSMAKVRQGRLYWTQVVRSNDIIRGFPYNVIQFTTIQEILAGWLGVELGSYCHWSDSLHLYDSDRAHFGAIDCEVKRSSDSLMSTVTEGEKIISDLYKKMHALTDDNLTKKQLEVLALFPTHPGFQSLFAVIAAEAARRRAWFDLMEQIEGLNNNAPLRQLWTLWKANRLSARSA